LGWRNTGWGLNSLKRKKFCLCLTPSPPEVVFGFFNSRMAVLRTRFHRVVFNYCGALRPAVTTCGGKIQATRFAGGR
jgi:hypothetical protein